MSYIDEINAFERWCEGNHLPAPAQLLWYKLMNVNNRCGWADWFSVDNRRLMMMIDTNSNTTAIRARDRLIEAGLLEYRKGKKGSPGKYHLVSVSDNVYKLNDIRTLSETENEPYPKHYVKHINRIDKNRPDKKMIDDVEERACAREENFSTENSSAEEADKGMAVVNYYRKLTGHDVTPNRLQLIDGYISDGAEPALICALLDYAVESNVHNVWQYTEAALMSCMDRGIYTLAAYQAEQKQRKERGRANGQATGVAESNTGGNAEENHDPRFGVWV